jgi:anaerobic selenocysteine-containing dehydrogenase
MKEVIKTICDMCYYYCGLDVTVEDGRITRVAGSREHVVNHGRLCVKGLACAQRVTDPNRLTTPLRRVGERGSGKWERISWDDALDEISGKLVDIREKYGPEYVSWYRGQAPGWVTNFNYVWRFLNSWGSPHLFTHSELCFVPRAIAHTATYGRPLEPDYEHANSIMLIGYNPVYTSPVNYAPRILWAKQRGAKLIVIDPRFTNTASKADLFLQPRPGTTGALTLAVVNEIIRQGWYDPDFIEKWTLGFNDLKQWVQVYTPEKAEGISGVPAAKIREAARTIATIKPALVAEGNGLDQHTNTVQTVRSTAILRALIQSVDEPGGGIMTPLLPFIDVQRRSSQPPDLFQKKSVCQYPLYAAGGFGLTGQEMVDSLLTQKPFGVKAIIVQGGDPVAVLSDSRKVRGALKDMPELLVVHDLYATATAQVADIVLPAASFLERDLVIFYRYRPFANVNLIAMQNKCVAPVGESRSDLNFIFPLARRVGLEEYFPWEKDTDAFDWELEPNGITVAWLREHPEGYLKTYKPEEIYRIHERDGYPTPTKKIQFVAKRFAEFGYDPLPNFVEPKDSPVSKPEVAAEYPLIGSVAFKLGIHTHTQFRSLPWIKEIEPEPFAEIHPETATRAGITDGEWMVVETPTGSLKARARTRYTVHPNVVMVAHGYGEPYAGDYDLSNTISSAEERDSIAGCTGNRSFLCRVKRANG